MFIPPVVEVLAGAAISAVIMATGASMKRSNEGRDAVIRLTVGVESIAQKLEQLHLDIRSDRKEIFNRLNSLETRMAKAEVARD